MLPVGSVAGPVRLPATLLREGRDRGRGQAKGQQCGEAGTTNGLCATRHGGYLPGQAGRCERSWGPNPYLSAKGQRFGRTGPEQPAMPENQGPARGRPGAGPRAAGDRGGGGGRQTGAGALSQSPVGRPV